MERSGAESAFDNIVRAYRELNFPVVASMLREFFDYTMLHKGWHTEIGCCALIRIVSEMLSWETMQAARLRLPGTDIEKRFSLVIAAIMEETNAVALASAHSEMGRGSHTSSGAGSRGGRAPML